MAFHDVVGEALVEEMVENEERAELRLQQRIIRDVSDPFRLPDRLFKSMFRFKKEVAEIIINMISEHMVQGQRNTAIPKHLKILACLHFYGNGSYQLTSGQGYNFAFSQPSMSRCIAEVTNVIVNHLLPTT